MCKVIIQSCMIASYIVHKYNERINVDTPESLTIVVPMLHFLFYNVLFSNKGNLRSNHFNIITLIEQLLSRHKIALLPNEVTL